MNIYLISRLHLTNDKRRLSYPIEAWATPNQARARAAVLLGEFCTAQRTFRLDVDRLEATDEKSGEKVKWEILEIRLTGSKGVVR